MSSSVAFKVNIKNIYYLIYFILFFYFLFWFVSIELTLYTLCIHNIYTCISVRPMFVLYVCVYYLKGASHY